MRKGEKKSAAVRVSRDGWDVGMRGNFRISSKVRQARSIIIF